ncbi:hypothetical protein BTR22_00745 [Alkalihalophilus pseudofirmus]|uniref:competence type IV pilus minor pilin ComGG n=1 Tax=Alkalihalophilus pseudofirmus TaxID=79885 RepID=UPI000950C4DB|nr:hypothetical protein BTR22_00745 [Alkalihalophilus pseudofirmus]
MRNDRGFVYPIVLIICTFLLFGLTVQTNVYLQEKRFAVEQQFILKGDTLIQRGLADFIVHAPSTENSTLFFSYEDGTVTLITMSKSETEWQVAATAELLGSTHVRRAQFYYDPYHQSIKEYWEVSKRDE